MRPWRYRIWNWWQDLGDLFGYLALPYRTVNSKLWDWCHYQHGAGAHLKLQPRTWTSIWKSELFRHRFGED